MIYCRVACACIVLIIPCGAVAETRTDADKTVVSAQAETDLTGYWQQDGGAIFRLLQTGSSLISRHSEQSDSNVENQIDFTATIYGNLIYGAYRAPFSRAQLAECSHQIWVGMGLTLNDDRTRLTGFRGARILDPKTCRVTDSAPVSLVYTRMDGPEQAN